MLTNVFRRYSFLLVSLLINCASPKAMTPINAADFNPELNSGPATQKAGSLIAEKPPPLPSFESAGVEKEIQPVKEAGPAVTQKPEVKVEPVPENFRFP